MSGMNYLGSISILDRGDGPAQAVIDRNARSLAQRMADETRDELNKVMSRVHTIYGAMDSTEDLFPSSATMEYLNDLAELEAILKDEIKKRQYQQQVTVFIVGYQDVCHQKLRLLQQVNEFFMENSKQIDEEDWFPTTPDLDIDEVSNAVEDSLNHAHELTSKLAVLNQEMVEYMANLAEKKASNKNGFEGKGKKKIEKALQQAKEEVNGLSEKLLTLQTELDDREEKVANLFKQMDAKNLELQKYRTAAELGKKATEDMEELRKQLSAKETKIISQRQQLSKMEVELAQSNHMKDRTEQKYSVSDEESQQKITILQRELDEQRKTNEDIKADMTKLLDNQIHALHESHKQEMDQLKKQHDSDNQKLQEELEQHKQELAQYQHDLITLQLEKGPETETPSEVARIVDLDSDHSQQTTRQSSKQESRPSTKDTKVAGKSGPGKSGKGSRSPTRLSRDSKAASRTSGSRAEEDEVFFDDEEESVEDIKDGKEYAEVAIQDEGGDPSSAVVDEKARTPNTRHSKRAVSTLAPVLESDFDNAFDLFDDEAWAAVPNDQMSGRFSQYRRLSTHRLLELEEQLQLTNAKTKRKVNTLKAQFQEHKGKWEAERRILIEQVEQSLRLQTDAEKEADAAMTQLEDFITEQERLEQEEEVKRNEVIQSSASLTPQDALTPLQGSVAASPTGAQQIVLNSESEQELQRLMQQTDDAKVQELNARLGTCASAPPAVSSDKNAVQTPVDESISSLEGVKIEGTTEEEIRSSSAQSRASLRNAYKMRLEETKSAVEDRRSKSPHINVPTQMTIDDELIIDEDDDEDIEELAGLPDLKEEFSTHKDPSMYEIGTSPPPGLPSRDPTDMSSRADGFKKGFINAPSRESTDPSREPPPPPVFKKILKKGIHLLQHPLLKEYLTTFNGVVSFKENMSKMFLDKDMMSAHQMISDLEMMTFDPKHKAMPQIEELTKNVCHVLEDISSLISSILVYDREPPVSSLNLISREATQKSFVPFTDAISEQPAVPPTTRENIGSAASSMGSHKSGRPQSISSDKMHIKELQEQYNELKNQLDQDSKLHQEQLQRNTVVMMEMQDTINELHRELSSLGKATKRSKSASSAHNSTAAQKSPSPETSVMFTRLDSERNAKIMKKAVVEDKLDQERYKEAVAKMDEYVSLPAQRLAHLVKKYVHHRRMREIEEKVKNSSSLDEEVFDVLDKMENLQNQRAQQWAATMDEMGIERLRLANLLMNTLENIEQESGIFLIKPMYSYRGRSIKPGTQGKLSRPIRSQHRNVTPTNDAASSFAPAPTPASNYRLVRHERHFLQQMQQAQSAAMAEMRPVEMKASKDDGGDVKIMGSGMTFSAGSPRLTWNMHASQPWTGKEDPNSFNTPRILELDINRMLIGQNNISSKIPFPPTDDRLVNASQNSLRSYVTVNRPTAVFGATEKVDKRPGSGRESSSRASGRQVTVSDTDRDIPTRLPTASPLPPITPIPGEEQEDSQEEEENEVEEMETEKMRPPSVAFSNEEEERNGDESDIADNKAEDEDELAKEPPQSPPGSSLYQSTLRNEDSESLIKPTRASSRLTLSEDEN